MSVFAAVIPPDPVVDHLASALRAVPTKPHLRRTDPGTWHVTLAFFGEPDASTTQRLAEVLETTAQRAEPVELALQGSGSFGSAWWVGVTGTLEPLAAAVATAARRAGADIETRPFHPHLTVGRVQRDRSLRPEIELLASYAGPRWVAREIHLIRSHPGKPLRHESLGVWSLGG